MIIGPFRPPLRLGTPSKPPPLPAAKTTTATRKRVPAAAPAPTIAVPRGAGATLFVPRSDGSFTRIDKTLCPNPKLVLSSPSGSTYIMDDHQAASCLGPDGAVRFRTPLPPHQEAAYMQLSGDASRLYVRTSHGIVCMDAKNGQTLGRTEPEPWDFSRRMLLLSNGNVLLSSFEHLTTYDADLNPLKVEKSGFRPQQLQELAGGHALVLDDGYPGKLKILGADGQVRFESEPYSYTTVRDRNGDVWTVTRPKAFSGSPELATEAEILRWSAADQTVRRMPGTQATEAVIPRQDGSYVVAHKYIDKPRLILYDAKGEQTCGFALGDDDSYRRHSLRHVLLRQDESQLYCVVEREDWDGKKEHRLYRLDLHGRARIQKDGYTSTAQESGVLLHRQEGRMVPVLLADGRVVVCGEKDMQLLDKDGQTLGTYVGPASLQQALGGLPQEDAHRLRLGHHTDPDPVLGIKNCMDVACAIFSYPESRPTAAIADNQRVDRRDDTLNFPGACSREAALAEIGLSETDYRDAQRPHDLLGYSWGKQHEVSFPDGLGGARVESDALVVRVAGADKERSYPLKGRAVAVVPFQTASGRYVAAATDSGLLYWCDAGRDKPEVYSVGAPVHTIRLGGDGRVRATSDDGRVLVFQPLLVPGETLVGTAPKQSPQVVVDGDTVRLGGVSVPRRGSAP